MSYLFRRTGLGMPPDPGQSPESGLSSHIKQLFRTLISLSKRCIHILSVLAVYPLRIISTALRHPFLWRKPAESRSIPHLESKTHLWGKRRRKDCSHGTSSSSINCLWKEKYLTAMEVNTALKEQLSHERQSRDIVQKVYADSMARMEVELTRAINNSLIPNGEENDDHLFTSTIGPARISSPMPSIRRPPDDLDVFDDGSSNPSFSSPSHGNQLADLGVLSPSSFDSLRLVCDPFECQSDACHSSTSNETNQSTSNTPYLTGELRIDKTIEENDDEQLIVEDATDFDTLAEKRIQSSLVSQVTLPSLILDLEDLSLKMNASNQDCCRVVLRGLLVKLAFENHLASPKHIHSLFDRFSRVFVHFSFGDETDNIPSHVDVETFPFALLGWLELFCLESTGRYTSHIILLKTFSDMDLFDSTDLFQWIASTPPKNVIHDSDNDFRKIALPFAIALRDEEHDDDEQSESDQDEDTDDGDVCFCNYDSGATNDDGHDDTAAKAPTVTFTVTFNGERSRKKSWSCRMEDMVDIVFESDSNSSSASSSSDESDDEMDDNDESDTSETEDEDTTQPHVCSHVPDGADSGFMGSEDESSPKVCCGTLPSQSPAKQRHVTFQGRPLTRS